MLDSMASPGVHRAPSRAARTDCAGVCDRTRQHDRGEEAADVKAVGGPVAAAVYRQGRRMGCSTPRGRVPLVRSAIRRCHRRRHSDVGRDTERRDPLEHAHAERRSTGVSPMRMHHLCQPFGLQPCGTRSFTLSPDPLRIDKVRDIVELYLNPPQPRCGLLRRRKAADPGLDRTAPLLHLHPGQAERRTHDWTRHGTTSRCASTGR